MRSCVCLHDLCAPFWFLFYILFLFAVSSYCVLLQWPFSPTGINKVSYCFFQPMLDPVIHKMITYVQNLEEKDLKDKVAFCCYPLMIFALKFVEERRSDKKHSNYPTRVCFNFLGVVCSSSVCIPTNTIAIVHEWEAVEGSCPCCRTSDSYWMVHSTAQWGSGILGGTVGSFGCAPFGCAAPSLMLLQNNHSKQTHLKAVQTANEAAGMMLNLYQLVIKQRQMAEMLCQT